MALFEGLSRDEKATAVLAHLSVDSEITIRELTARAGLTIAQAHQGIRYLREARNCVVTNRRGPDSTYKLAENAPEVRDYAVKRMSHWQTQIGVMRNEMELARQLLPGAESVKVQKAAEVLTSLLRIMELDEVARKEDVKREAAMVRRENKVLAKR
jgi:DNA-binding IscR family transcriptional regulator